jgi:hypothetical protein
MTRAPSGQPVRVSSPVSSATSAFSRTPPSAASTGVRAVAGRAVMAARSASATDPDLKADYEEAHSYLQALIDNERQANDEEDDNDW